MTGVKHPCRCFIACDNEQSANKTLKLDRQPGHGGGVRMQNEMTGIKQYEKIEVGGEAKHALGSTAPPKSL